MQIKAKVEEVEKERAKAPMSRGTSLGGVNTTKIDRGKQAGVVFCVLEGFLTTAMAAFLSEHVHGLSNHSIGIERAGHTSPLTVRLKCVTDAAYVPGIV